MSGQQQALDLPMTGVYLVAGGTDEYPGLPACGPFRVGAHGPLSGQAHDGPLSVLFEGLLLDSRPDTGDAQVALEAFARGGSEAVERLDGFFTAICIDHREGRAWIVCDPLATRPHYVYSRASVVAIAPVPSFFAALGLPMSLDRVALYQTFRTNHPIGRRTLASEVERCMPLTTYTVTREGGVTRRAPDKIVKEPDAGMGVREAADRIKSLHQRIVRDILRHPKLAGRGIHLPLTAGMDSRHILADLVDLDQPPASLRHIKLALGEYEPVAAMATGLGIPLEARSLLELDIGGLIGRWVRASAGMVHLHQLYLMGVADDVPDPGVIGFDGYLADFYLGFYRLPRGLQQRSYTKHGLPLLFPDLQGLAAQTNDEIQAQFDYFVGSPGFSQGGADTFNRGLRYTGSVFPILGERALYFAPGAHRDAFEFFRTAPETAADFKRARLRMFQDHFPEIAAYRGPTGQPYIGVEQLAPNKSKGWRGRLAKLRGRVLADRSFVSEQKWLRNVPGFRRALSRVVKQSKLAEHGALPPHVLRLMWASHHLGAELAWTLMTVATVEVAYRCLVLGEPTDDVARWLTQ